jgi:hypothetical protein
LNDSYGLRDDFKRRGRETEEREFTENAFARFNQDFRRDPRDAVCLFLNLNLSLN